MRVYYWRLFASFLILFALTVGACAHNSSTVQSPAPDQGASSGRGGY